MKKILLFIIIFSSSLVLAQDIKNQSDKELNKNVYGYVINGNRIYLVTDNGFLSVYKNNKTNKQWEDYYKKIYDDSTIVNPNTVIETNNNNAYLNYIIPVDVNKQINKKYSFVGDLHWYKFKTGGKRIMHIN